MKLGLLGFPISHSLSPKLYKDILGPELESYELIEIKNAADIPSLSAFSKKFDGLNITAPYKKHFFGKVIIESLMAEEIQAINTLAFKNGKFYGTNTDVVAVRIIFKNLISEFGSLHVKILGNGVMAKVTDLVAKSLGIPTVKYFRGQGIDLTKLDLTNEVKNTQTIIVNTCSREFIYEGEIDKNVIFWDHNYNFLPHQKTLSSRVKSYRDGQEMLELQAKAAVEFWNTINS